MMKKPSPLALTFIILAVIAGGVVALSGVYVDWLWFQSVGFTGVWSTVLTTKIALFIVAGLVTSLIISANVYIAYRRRPSMFLWRWNPITSNVIAPRLIQSVN
jgi:uncharacterized protein